MPRGLTRPADRAALADWNKFNSNFGKSGDINIYESEQTKLERKERLLEDFGAFKRYYFPKVANSPDAPWHIEYNNYVIANEKATAVVKVSRDMGKTSNNIMLLVYLALKGNIKSVGYFSRTADQATGLLSGVKRAFESNARIIHDFGNQKGYDMWTDEQFITTGGCSFRAIGLGQNPRGQNNDGQRFDTMVFDDSDDDEVCRNPDRLEQDWQYILGACIPAFHVSGPRRLLFANNAIAEDCLVQRAWDHFLTISDTLATKPLLITVNLMNDDRTESNWAAYTAQECLEMIALAGSQADTEYFNQPSLEGVEFKKDWFVFKPCLEWNKYKYILSYHDYGFSKAVKKGAATKALVLVGYHNHEFHILKVYLDSVSMPTAVAWHYDLYKLMNERGAPTLMYMEDVFLVDVMYDEFARAIPEYGFPLPIIGDKRDKPDKDLRISATAAHFEKSRVYFDSSLQHDRHTKTLIDQYKKFRKGNKTKRDGPDAVEGTMFLLTQMAASAQGTMSMGSGRRNSKRI